jgi:predicted RNA binding protein YcfA (HicA-like mRNA interferase family)
MQKLPNLSGHEVIKILFKFGFVTIRQKGSHVILEKATSFKKIYCVIPLHKELKKGTLTGILRQAQISREEFLKYV